jgi:hypothetical protein
LIYRKKQEDSREGGGTLPMAGQVSEQIHDRISYVKGDGLIEGQEVHDDRVIEESI